MTPETKKITSTLHIGSCDAPRREIIIDFDGKPMTAENIRKNKVSGPKKDTHTGIQFNANRSYGRYTRHFKFEAACNFQNTYIISCCSSPLQFVSNKCKEQISVLVFFFIIIVNLKNILSIYKSDNKFNFARQFKHPVNKICFLILGL